jgi:D-sedoheptulose 7-phosphate isomerase
MTTLGITGYSGGALRQLAQHSLHCPLDDMGTVESLHMVAFHWLIGDLYRRISGPVAEAKGA